MGIKTQALGLVFAVAACVLAFEVALTRICSVLLSYHMSFAVVSLAILGLGIGGFVADVATRRRPERARQVALLALLGLSPGLLLALVVLFKLPFATQWPWLLPAVLPPFVAAGVLQSLLLRAFAPVAAQIYAADLVGGAVGALASVLLIDVLRGPVYVILVLALMVAVLTWICWRALGVHTQLPRSVSWLPALCVLVAAVAVLSQSAARIFEVDYRHTPQKLIHALMQPRAGVRPRLLPELVRWDAYSRVDVLEVPSAGAPQRLVFIDGETPTPLLPPAARTPGAAGRPIEDALVALPYRAGVPRRVLSIGSGAGYDVVVAKRFDVAHVDAVELNAGVLEVVEQAKDFAGDVYGQPGVDVHHAEGRQFARRQPQDAYDLIVLVLAQSLAGNMREYALSENYLYTRQAFDDYLRLLGDGGSIVLLLNNSILVRKLVATAFDALARRGLPAPECVVALSSPRESPYDHLVWVRSQPFDSTTLATVAGEIERRGYTPLHLPALAIANPPRLEPSQLTNDAQHRLDPATDDKPFFFHVLREMPPGLRLLIGCAAALLVVALASFAWVVQGGGESRWAVGRAASYFIALGLAYLMVEVLALQKAILIIGFPTLNLGVVLAAFLLATGLGSACSQRWLQKHTQRRLKLVLLLVAAGSLLLVPALEWLHALVDAWPLPARCAALCVMLFPLGVAMGMPFPTGIRLLPRSMIEHLPWLWGLNGVASILGSALIVACVLEVGFRGSALLPALLYACAVVLAPGSARGKLG